MGLLQWLFQTAPKPNPAELTKDLIAEFEGQDLEELFSFQSEEFLSDLGVDELAETVKKMLEDDQVSAEMETFKTFVGNTTYIVQPADEKDPALAELYTEYITREGGRLIAQISNFYDALDYGFVICETIWRDPALTGGAWVIDRLKPLDPSRYGFNKKGEMVDRAGGLILDTPYKYVAVSHDVRQGNLNGNALVLKAYWPWFFRKICIKAGLLYVKKAIIPSIVAIFKGSQNATTTAEQGALIAKELTKLANSSGIALANIEKIETVDATSKGTDIIDLVEMFNRMISKAILGVATLTNDTRYSNRGDTTSQENLIEARAQKVTTVEQQPAINTLLRWTLELNQGEIDPLKLPTFKYIYEYDPSYEETIKAVTARIPVSGKWFYKKFNVGAPEDDDDVLVDPQVTTIGGEFSAPNKDAFFLRSEPPKNRPQLINAIYKSLRSITAKR